MGTTTPRGHPSQLLCPWRGGPGLAQTAQRGKPRLLGPSLVLSRSSAPAHRAPRAAGLRVGGPAPVSWGGEGPWVSVTHLQSTRGAGKGC